MKLPKKIKNKWIKALRSGKYKQTEGRLYDPETKGFCCLGVLQECVTGQVELNYGDDPPDYTFAGMPSRMFMEGIGVELEQLEQSHPDTKCCSVMQDKHLSDLVEMNDDGHSFEAIADYIEKNVETI